jgi:4-hydroxy-tetrahydrodipicolinate reductase
MTAHNTLRVGVCGALGRMGSITCAAVRQDPELRLNVAVDPGFSGTGELEGAAPSASATLSGVRCYADLEAALTEGGVDVMVDFTVPAAVRTNVLTCLAHRVPVVVGTTGLSTGDLEEIATAALQTATPVLVAPNFALGAVLMMKAAQMVAEHLRACEIVELHHDRKLDAPSGTSQLTRALIAETWRAAGFGRDIPIHSVRLPGLVAHQEVIFGGVGETLTIRHDSLSRESFMPGVLLAIKRVRSLQGLVVGLEKLL